MLVKALLVGLVLGFCKSEWMYGFPMTGRPIVVSTLTGLVLGDPVQGVILGSILELMFIGAFNVGVALYPDYTSAYLHSFCNPYWRWKGSSYCVGSSNRITGCIYFCWYKDND